MNPTHGLILTQSNRSSEIGLKTAVSPEAKVDVVASPSEDLSNYTPSQLIEFALQLDACMYERIHPVWQNPGMAALCSFRLIADALEAHGTNIKGDVKALIEKINSATDECLKLVKEKGVEADFKLLLNSLFEYEGGFQHIFFSPERFQLLAHAVNGLPRKSQLCYRQTDGRFFLLVDNRYITNSLAQCTEAEKPRAAIGHAHIVLNEGMPREEGQKLWSKLSESLEETIEPTFSAAQPGIRYLCRELKFQVIGAYEGIPKTNSRLKHTFHLEVKIEEEEWLNQLQLLPQLNDYVHHITFGEKVRPQSEHSLSTAPLEDLLSRGSLVSRQLQKFLFEGVQQRALDYYSKEAKSLQIEGFHDQALAFYQKALEAAEKLFNEDNAALAIPYLRTAKSFYLAHRYDEADSKIQKLMALNGKSPTLLARAYRWFGIIQFRRGDHVNALQNMDESLTISLKENYLRGVIKALGHRGNILIEKGEYAQAEKIYQKALLYLADIPSGNHKLRLEGWLLINQAHNFSLQERYNSSLHCYEAALELLKKCLPKHHRSLVRLYTNLGKTYGQLDQQDKAIEALKKGIFSQSLRDGRSSSLIASSYSNLAQAYISKGDFDAALKFNLQAVKIDESLHGFQHLYTAKSYHQLATIYMKKGDMRRGLSYLEMAHEILNKSLIWKDHIARYDIQLSLIRAYEATANSAQEATRKQQIEKAIELANDLKAWNMKILTPILDEVTAYDLIGSIELLELLINLHLQNSSSQSAAEICWEEACQWQKRLPHLALYWIKQGLEILKTKHNSLSLSHFYQLRASIAKDQNRFWYALRSLNCALSLEEKPEVRKLYTEYMNLLELELQDLDEDLFMQLERAEEIASDLEMLYLEDLKQTKTLSNQSKNRTAALFISLRNLLDIGFLRWVQGTVWKPNQSPGGEAYFPIASSFLALQNSLLDKQLLHPIFQISDFEIKDQLPDKKLLIQHLISIGYINQDGTLTQMAFTDLSLTHLGQDYLIYQPFLRSLMADMQLGELFNLQLLNRTTIEKVAKQLLLQNKFKLKEVAEILFEDLLRYGYVDKDNKISNLIHSDPQLSLLPPRSQVYVTPFLKPLLVKIGVGGELNEWMLKRPEIAVYESSLPTAENLINTLINNGYLVKSENGAYYLSETAQNSPKALPLPQNWSILQPLLLKMINAKLSKASLDRGVNRPAYDAFILEQDFSYYKESRIRQNPQTPDQSWLCKLSTIQNDAKHIRLTPQGLANQVESRQASITTRHVTIHIEYLETRFYGWSFMEILLDEDSLLTKIEALTLSREILRFLKERSYINNQIVNYPLDESKLKNDLATHNPKWIRFAGVISALLVRKARQQRRLDLVPDSFVDARWLIATSLKKVRALLKIFGQARRAVKQQLVIPNLSPILQDLKALHLGKKLAAPSGTPWIAKAAEKHLAQLRPTINGNLKLLAEQHLHLNYLVDSLKEQEKLNEIADHYLKSAQFFLACPWLSLHYYQKAFDFFKAAGENSRLPALALDIAKLKVNALGNNDFSSQWLFCKENLVTLQFKSFQLFMVPDDYFLSHQIHSQALDLVIKLRHILDQALGRFTKTMFYPNQVLSFWDAHFPCCQSEEEMKQFLVKDIADQDPHAYTIDQHPLWTDPSLRNIYDAICQTQPFKGAHWLEELRQISNLVKHQGLQVPAYDHILARKNLASTLQEFYPSILAHKTPLFILLEEAVEKVGFILNTLKS